MKIFPNCSFTGRFTLIHLNDSLPAIYKFHYLRALIGQRVVEIIASIKFSSDNYGVAWELICGRFNNDKSLVPNHSKRLGVACISGHCTVNLREDESSHSLDWS